MVPSGVEVAVQPSDDAQEVLPMDNPNAMEMGYPDLETTYIGFLQALFTFSTPEERRRAARRPFDFAVTRRGAVQTLVLRRVEQYGDFVDAATAAHRNRVAAAERRATIAAGHDLSGDDPTFED